MDIYMLFMGGFEVMRWIWMFEGEIGLFVVLIVMLIGMFFDDDKCYEEVIESGVSCVMKS